MATVRAALGPDSAESARGRLRIALRVCGDPQNLRRTLAIAIVVGVVLTVINQLDVLLEGEATRLTSVKVVLNFCVPFVVSNLGLLLGGHARRT